MLFALIYLIAFSFVYGDDGCNEINIRVSSSFERNLEVSWNLPCLEPPYSIQLRDSQNVLDVLDTDEPEGYLVSNQTFPQAIVFPDNWNRNDTDPVPQSSCFDFYAAVVQNETDVISNCLKIEPAWMQNFGDVRIGKLMIPGTHDSGAWLSNFPLLEPYILAQNNTFWEQLVFGIRYFDIRIGHNGGGFNGFFMYHGEVKCTEFIPELQSVLSFIQKSPNEVVILNVHSFEVPPDFTSYFHNLLLEVLTETLGDNIYPYRDDIDIDGPTLSEFWDSGKRIIISYNDEETRSNTSNSWLWPTVRRYWGDKIEVDDLEQYVKANLDFRPIGSPMSVIMAELTPTSIYVFTHLDTAGLRDLAELVNPRLGTWLRENNRTLNANIIATDFFMGNDIINLAIQTNERKLRKTF